MKRLIVLSLTALLAAGYASASFADDQTSTTYGINQTGTDYWHHRHHRHCRRGWYGMDDYADNDSVDAE